MKRFILTITALFLISSISSLAGTISPNGDDEKHLEYGSKFHSVLGLCGIDNDDKLFCGSAVAIHPEWVLTAAHVVHNSKHCGVNIGDNSVILIDKIIIHKDFNGDFGKADIALCKLTKKLDLTFYPKLYNNDDELGKICSIAGYGLTGNFNTGAIKSDEKKRAGSNIIDKLDQDLLICTPSKPNENKTALEYIICSGDSGGGLFIGNELAGINSCVIASDKIPDSTYNDEAGHTRISKFVDWIEENLDVR